MNVTIPGDPVGKGRPRVTRTGHAYTPASTAAWEAMAATLLRSAWAGREPLAEPVRVTIHAAGRRPKTMLPRSMGGSCPDSRPPPLGRTWRTTKPDADNVAKAVLDAMVRAGVLRDDVYAVEVTVRSLYAALDEGPGVEVGWEVVR